jgi:hypothetical protein
VQSGTLTVVALCAVTGITCGGAVCRLGHKMWWRCVQSGAISVVELCAVRVFNCGGAVCSQGH